MGWGGGGGAHEGCTLVAGVVIRIACKTPCKSEVLTVGPCIVHRCNFPKFAGRLLGMDSELRGDIPLVSEYYDPSNIFIAFLKNAFRFLGYDIHQAFRCLQEKKIFFQDHGKQSQWQSNFQYTMECFRHQWAVIWVVLARPSKELHFVQYIILFFGEWQGFPNGTLQGKARL